MNIGYVINEDVKRPSSELISKFAAVPVPNIGDSMNRMAAIGSEISSVNGVRLMGSAYTVRVPAGDNLLFYYAIDQAKEGDVIVVDGGGFENRALCGEIMASYAAKRKLAGFVINGAIRDRVEISQMSFPVFAKSACPNGPYKNGPGEINVPVNIGGRIINPGDILIGDGNGLVSFSQEDAEEIYQKACMVMEKETNIMQRIEEKGEMDLRWMYDKLRSDHCSIASCCDSRNEEKIAGEGKHYGL